MNGFREYYFCVIKPNFINFSEKTENKIAWYQRFK